MIGLLLAASLLAAARDAPEPIDRTAEIRCVIASVALASSAQPGFAGLGQMSALFWMGRLGAFEEDELERTMSAETLKMTEADLKLELQRCGAEMKRSGDALQRIGEKMKQRAARADTR